MDKNDYVFINPKQIQALKDYFDRQILKHNLDLDLFWQSQPRFKLALDALPDLYLWRQLDLDFCYMLLPALEALGIDLDEDWKRRHMWLLAPETKAGLDRRHGLSSVKRDRRKN